MIKSRFFDRATAFILILTLCMTMTTFTVFAGGEEDVFFEQTFDTITDLSEEAAISVNHNTSADSYADITDGAFVFGKTASGTATAAVNMASYIGDATDYTVSFDLKLATSGSTVSVKLGSCVAFRPSGSNYTMEWHDGSAWITSDKTAYDFAGGLNVKFVVKSKEKADLYIDGKLVQADIPRREDNNNYLFDKMIFELANGLRGDIAIDNIKAYIPGEEEEPEVSPVVYSQDFSQIFDISEEGIYTLKQNGDETAYAKVENELLRIGKTTKGGASLDIDFSSKLGALTDYLVSMDVTADIADGYTVNIRLGSTVAIRAIGDGMYTVEWNDGSSWITSDVTEYNLKNGATVRFLVKNQEAVDMYIGNHLVQADIPRRYSQPFTKLGFDLGNSMTGSFTLDNIVVTSDTTIETLPEPEPEPEPDLPENAVSTSDIPTVGAPDVAKEDFDLYLAIGQSNMAGRAPLEKEDKISLHNTYLLNGDDEWETAQAQYVDGKWCGFNRYSTVRKTEAAQGLSPSFYFAKTVSESVGGENKKIGIISNARGDTSIGAWQKGYTHDTKDFDLYEEAVRRAKIAMESGNLKGIIWHQGCANISNSPSSYIEQFSALIDNLRADLEIADLPVIIGEIPGFGSDDDKIEARMSFNKNCIAQLPLYVDNCYAVSSAGSRDIGDKTHFDNAAQKRLGKLYGETALEKIYGSDREELNTVPLKNITGSDTAAAAADGKADIHAWAEEAAYWSAAAGDTFTAELAQPVTVKEIKSYFRNPYNYVAQYRIYLGNGGSWSLAADNSGITSYPYIGADGAVVDDIEDTYADSIMVEITGGLNIDGAAVSDIIGCHEFEVKTADTVSVVTVGFEGYTGSADISVQDADKLTVKADSADGIKEVRVYFNDSLEATLTQAPYEFDISTLGVSETVIKAVAQSNNGDTAEAVLNLTVNNKFLSAVFEDSSFEPDGASKTVSGIAMNSQRGYVIADTVDEAHGTSLLVGMDTVNEEYTSGSLPHINIPLGGIADKFTLTCDLYVSAKDSSGDKKLTVYQKSGMEQILVQFKDNASSGGKSFGYETGTWYSMRFDIDVASKTFDSYVDGELVASGSKMSDSFEAANYIRLYGQRNDDVKAYTAIDNVRVLKEYEYPSVVSVTGGGTIAPEAESFDIVLDKALKKSGITTGTVTLQDEYGGSVPLEAVVWSSSDNRLTVTPKNQFTSNTSYILTLSGDVQLESGVAISLPLKVKLKTDMRGVEVADAEFSYSGGALASAVTLYNSTEGEKTVYAVMSVWKGNEFAGMDVEKVTISAARDKSIDMSVTAPEGAKAEIYVFESLSVPVYTGGRIYSN